MLTEGRQAWGADTMAKKHDEEWREFYTEVGFRHGFALGANAIRDAVAPHLTPGQLKTLDQWLAGEVAEWRRDYLKQEEPPRPPKLQG
jgi:hypothetical protein